MSVTTRRDVQAARAAGDAGDRGRLWVPGRRLAALDVETPTGIVNDVQEMREWIDERC